MMNFRIQTFTGRTVDPMRARPTDIVLEDIAHALSQVCRFGGHTIIPYSVAQHSVLVSERVPVEDALWGLLHDAAEAYVGDLIRPVRNHVDMGPFREVEALLQRVICTRFGLPCEMPESVRVADDRMLATEARDLLVDPGTLHFTAQPYETPIAPAMPQIAEADFIERYRVLTGSSRTVFLWECLEVLRGVKRKPSSNESHRRVEQILARAEREGWTAAR